MFKQELSFRQVHGNRIPIELLLEADPSEKSIRSYLDSASFFAIFQNENLIGVCVVNSINNDASEILNVSVYPEYQKQGLGTELLKFALKELSAKGVKRVELGTGSFGYQLTYYQRLGFRVESVIKDFFIKSYPEPIFENGIQHKDMLRLYLDL